MGWNSGFHYYLLVMAPLIFLNPYWLPGLQLVLLTAVGALYLGLYEAVDRYGPVVPLPEGVLPLIHHLNVAAAFGLLSFFAYYFSRASVEADAELRRLATTDPLTGLDNRRRALEIAEAEVTRRGRSGEAFSLILGDVDGFKGINDQRGHDCGDIILVALAVRLREALRAQDTVARWGGEEFLVLLPETEERGARQVAEKVRAALLREPFRCRGGGIEVTMTFGVAEHAEGESLANALVRADRALLAGKRAGKNRVLVASELGPAGEREMTQFVITRQPGEE
jgi:diguanylate cyclase (GGDEF)-like protein